MNLSDYKHKTELHAHTSPASGCADLPPESVVRMYSELGYSSIVLSNHFHTGMRFYGDKQNAVESYLRDFNVASEYGRRYGINVILGCEIRFTENMNDYLLFGINQDFLNDAYEYLETDIKTFSDWFRNDSRLLIQAHPFRNNITLAPPDTVDGIESFNMHPNHNSRVAYACRYAKEHNFTVTCGTDFHHNGHEGMIALLTKQPVPDSAKLAEILKSRDYLFGMGDNIILPYGC